MRDYQVWALLAVLCVQALTAAAVIGLGRREAALAKVLPFLVSAAAGVLLATALLDLLPDAVRVLGTGPKLWNALLLSLLGLFCVQACAHALAGSSAEPGEEATSGGGAASQGTARTHNHGRGPAVRLSRPASLLLGSALHSAVDGTAIAAAFLADSRSGWMVAAAVALHELPHRTGDFALLLHMGLEKRRAAALAICAGAAALLGWLLVAVLGAQGTAVRWCLPVSAASFLYIALVDLLPELQHETNRVRMLLQVACLGAGAALAAALVQLPGE